MERIQTIIRRMTDDKDLGLYSKYIIKRLDGSSDPGGKHEDCNYFVLDFKHDEYAKEAIKAYAKACKNEYPQLSKDLLNYFTDDQ